MRIRADKARDMAINGAKRQFYKEIKSACKEGKFYTDFSCKSSYELSIYTSLAKRNGYGYVVCANGIEISW